MVVRWLVVSALFLGALCGGGAAYATRDAVPLSQTCDDEEIPVPDERDGTRNLCLAKSEWERAREICERIEPGGDPLACTCQDGDDVRACGD